MPTLNERAAKGEKGRHEKARELAAAIVTGLRIKVSDASFGMLVASLRMAFNSIALEVLADLHNELGSDESYDHAMMVVRKACQHPTTHIFLVALRRTMLIDPDDWELNGAYWALQATPAQLTMAATKTLEENA